MDLIISRQNRMTATWRLDVVIQILEEVFGHRQDAIRYLGKISHNGQSVMLISNAPFTGLAELPEPESAIIVAHKLGEVKNKIVYPPPVHGGKRGWEFHRLKQNEAEKILLVAIPIWSSN